MIRPNHTLKRALGKVAKQGGAFHRVKRSSQISFGWKPKQETLFWGFSARLINGICASEENPALVFFTTVTITSDANRRLWRKWLLCNSTETDPNVSAAWSPQLGPIWRTFSELRPVWKEMNKWNETLWIGHEWRSNLVETLSNLVFTPEKVSTEDAVKSQHFTCTSQWRKTKILNVLPCNCSATFLTC